MGSIIQLPKRRDPRRFAMQAVLYAIPMGIFMGAAELLREIGKYRWGYEVASLAAMVFGFGCINSVFRAIFGYRPKPPGTE